jgi:hypothetical protein
VLLALSVGSTVPLFGLGMLLLRGCDEQQPASSVGNALWYEGAGGPRLLVMESLGRSGDTESYTVNRLVALDPATGAQTDTWVLETSDDRGLLLWAARGPWVWTLGGDSWHPELAVRKPGEEPIAVGDLAGRFPQIAGPWAGAIVTEEGLLRVESDDKKRWEIDLAADTARERPDLSEIGNGWSGADNAGCYSATWTWGDVTYAFAEREAARHSQRDHWALITARPEEYGQLTELSEVAPGFSLPSFACNDTSGPVSLGQDALVIEHDDGPRFSRMDHTGQRKWSWKAPETEGAVEAWPVAGGVVVRTGRTFTSLDGEGKVRWGVGR